MLSAISISLITICFICYYFTIHVPNIHGYFKEKHGEQKAMSTWIIFQRLTGVFFFGVVAIAAALLQGIDLTSIGLTLDSKSPVWGWIFGLSAVCTLVNYFACQKQDHLDMYPQIRTPQPWSRSLLLNSTLTLFLYTLAYEVMFRGYLLFTCERELGVVLAVVINTAIYALVHIPKGWKETVGSFPMGIILCWLTLKTGNIWIAVVVHVSLALSSEWFSIAQHRKRQLVVH